MKRDEFIKWLEESSGFSRYFRDSDNSWKQEMNYAEFIYDYLEVNDNDVEFIWENLYWGGSENKTNKYSFDEFVERYTNSSLKY